MLTVCRSRAFLLVFFGALCQEENMKLLFCSIFLLLMPCYVHAQDYDSFVLKYQSVRAAENLVSLELVLEQPKQHNIDAALKNGAILKLVFDIEVLEKKFFRNKLATTASLSYYLRYDPLTRQFTAMQESKTIARNADADFLLNLLLQHIKIEIPCKLEQNVTYLVQTKVDLLQSNARSWFGTDMLIGPDKIIQPVEFEYEFGL